MSSEPRAHEQPANAARDGEQTTAEDLPAADASEQEAQGVRGGALNAYITSVQGEKQSALITEVTVPKATSFGTPDTR